MKDSYENIKKELIQVCTYNGYEIENPTWEFQHYAVVIEQDERVIDVFDGSSYQMYKKGEPLEVGDSRGRKSALDIEFQRYMDKHGDSIDKVDDYLEFSGCYVPYGSFPYSQRNASENGYLRHQKDLVLSYMKKINNHK